MSRRVCKFTRARMVALAVGVGAFGSVALGSLALAPASFAKGLNPQPPAVGTACQQDGKISGRGSTFQTNALNLVLIAGYTNNVCGPVGGATNLAPGYGGTDPAGSNMLAYNYSEGGTAVKNGSGAGIAAMECRTDPFAGTDLPYNNTQLAAMNGAPGTGQTCPGSTAANVTSFLGIASPPYPPGGASGPYPNPAETTPGFNGTSFTCSDTNSPTSCGVMSVPVAAGAVAIAVNLNGVCTSGPPTGLDITSHEFDEIWQGTINQWNDPQLVATDPILSTDGCSGFIQRIVRSDNSGTSAITKNDLNGIDSGTLCDGEAQQPDTYGAWGASGSASPNTTWPEGCTDVNSNTAPAVYAAGTIATSTVSATNTGSPNLIALLTSNSTPSGDQPRGGTSGGTAGDCPPHYTGTANNCGGEGGIGYAELGLWGSLPSGDSFVLLESAGATATNGLGDGTPPSNSFVSPGSPGAASNCNVGINGLPGASVDEAVGLGGTNDNWANDAGAPATVGGTGSPNEQKENITFSGSGYPACGLTFDFVYTGTNDETGEATPVTGASTTVAGPYVGMTNDQLRTLYSYFTYVFSPLGQSTLPTQTYDQLPATWLPTLLSGFQDNF